MAALLDTGFLLAVIDADDHLHSSCVAGLQSESHPVLPDVVLPELSYLILRELGHSVLAKFLRAVASGELVQAHSVPEDLVRAADLLEKYADNKVDFVDCAIVAMAERMNVSKILTVDRRHFTMFRPRHCEYFEISP
jgi:predicted nucleic acid-binding protein